MMRCSIGSQCRLHRDGVTRSNFLKPHITFAAAKVPRRANLEIFFVVDISSGDKNYV